MLAHSYQTKRGVTRSKEGVHACYLDTSLRYGFPPSNTTVRNKSGTDTLSAVYVVFFSQLSISDLILLTLTLSYQTKKRRHPLEGGGPCLVLVYKPERWIPAYAGMTRLGTYLDQNRATQLSRTVCSFEGMTSLGDICRSKQSRTICFDLMWRLNLKKR